MRRRCGLPQTAHTERMFIAFSRGTSISVALASHTRELEVEADIFSESRGMGNKIATNHVIGTGEEKM